MNNKLKELFSLEPDFNQIPGGIKLPYEPLLKKYNEGCKMVYENKDKSISLFENVIDSNECKNIIDFFIHQGKFSPVSVQGFNDNEFNGEIGSNRITGFNGDIAMDFYFRIEHLLENKICDDQTSTDWWQELPSIEDQVTYKPIGLSPMLRFMKYSKGGKHYPHYDAGFIYPEEKYRTLKSFVLYLTTNNSGATRFIKDKQLLDKMPITLRDHSDWSIEPLDKEIEMEFLPVKGNMLIFDHRLCHDVNEYIGDEGDRIIIRGDVLYERI